MEEREYKGWLVSNNLLKRSFAVVGHYALASLIVTSIVFIILFIIGMLIGIISVLLSS